MAYEIGAPPAHIRTTVTQYDRGYAWGEQALVKYGNEACAGLMKSMGEPKSAYEQGTFDAFDKKAKRYG